MKRLIIGIIGITFFILPVVSACNTQKQTGQAGDIKTLFEKKCDACHGIKKATGQKKNQAEWTETVMRMKNKNGAPVNDEEAKIIIGYLAKNYGK
jgi:mono/diheme cytochrome c family protein